MTYSLGGCGAGRPGERIWFSRVVNPVIVVMGITIVYVNTYYSVYLMRAHGFSNGKIFHFANARAYNTRNKQKNFYDNYSRSVCFPKCKHRFTFSPAPFFLKRLFDVHRILNFQMAAAAKRNVSSKSLYENHCARTTLCAHKCSLIRK